MKVLVTGGAGFIGSHTVDLLLKEGYDVRVLDNISTGKASNLDKRVELIIGSVMDINIVKEAVQQCDAVIHLAALVSVPESIKNPLDTYSINTMGFANVLDMARLAGVSRCVLASSCAVYGNKLDSYTEESKVSPLVPYAFSKLMAEELAISYAISFEMEVVRMRYFNVYGLRQSDESSYSGVIARWCKAVQSDGSCIIFGDGSQTRDFVSVYDVAQANLIAVKTALDERSPCYNVSTGVSTSLNTVIDTLESLVSKNINREYLPSRSGDILHSGGNSLKLQNAGWKPQISIFAGLDDILNHKFPPEKQPDLI
jgi:UDP-glucose 4-epimerase